MKMDRRQKRAYVIALEELGTREIRGAQHNPQIVEYAAKVGHDWVEDDETPWCASFLGWALEEADLPSTRKLNARSYLDWGKPVDINDAQPGDVLERTDQQITIAAQDGLVVLGRWSLKN